LYSIKFDGSGKKLITEATGTHSIDMPQSGKYFIDKYSNSHQITSTYLYSTNGELIHKFFEPDMSFIQEYGFTPVEFQSFTTSDGVELNSFLIKPHDFDKNKKYPVIIYNYSGPGSKTVTDKWMSYYYLLHQYFAQNGFLVFAVDNRGTGGRGREFEHTVYKNLGKWELNDIIEGINWLNKSGFIDTSRIAIYGTSYGGYMAALALLKAPEYFKAGIAAAGLSHWKYYDAIYTERFMQDEQLNPAGYFESAPVNYAGNLSGKLLIIHGTADDNVHFHNSVELVEELITKNKQFDLMIYPGKKHGGFGLHYYYLIADYILKNL
jgi:dipeptidyl-peptidase-4